MSDGLFHGHGLSFSPGRHKLPLTKLRAGACLRTLVVLAFSVFHIRDERVRAMTGIIGVYDQLEDLPGVMAPGALFRAFWLARHGVPGPPPWSLDSSIYHVAHRIRCPMLLVYGALEPELYRVTAEKLARLVPTAKTKVWRRGRTCPVQRAGSTGGCGRVDAATIN